MDLATDVASLDEATLGPVVEQLLGAPVSELVWASTPIGYKAANPMSDGLFRFSGTARLGRTPRPWSVVLKSLRPPTAADAAQFGLRDSDRIRHAYRWDREALAYESGLLTDLPPGLRAARYLGSQRQPERCSLWLEDLGQDENQWDLARYALAARHLGRFNGAYGGRRVLPSHVWLSRGWLRTWLEVGLGSRGIEVLDDDAVWEHPLVGAAFAADTRSRLRHAWAGRGQLLDALDRVPATLCHLDAFRANLFGRSDGSGAPETVAIDWSYVGLAPVGSDLAQLTIASVFYHGDTHDIRALEAATFPGYLNGLRESGWGGTEDDARSGYALAAAARFFFMLGVARAAPDPARRARLEAWTGVPFETQLTRLAERTEYILELLAAIKMPA